ncbi:nuclear transcription factor Y subunit B-4-like [Carica papaya]|uniref:nuclear transcription factor Y subunit B-4-like n=1 Tax=Carica papaya TaxID=3649 RepID=UPI000B8CF7CB|nr:nuclear transcription factor Y subunit B-4-like [Carica papaya]
MGDRDSAYKYILDREGDHHHHHQDHHYQDHEVIKEQDRLLPIANVGRIMKQILPPKAKISKEAKETMQECVSEFISFVTGEASVRCNREKRKTVNGDDVCWALASLGFDNYAEQLRRYLQRYRETEGERSSSSHNQTVGASDSVNDRRKMINLFGIDGED